MLITVETSAHETNYINVSYSSNKLSFVEKEEEIGSVNLKSESGASYFRRRKSFPMKIKKIRAFINILQGR